MFTEKAKKNADACRFCWMCRHLCPVQLVTGKETNTPRARGLHVSMIERGMPMEKDCAANMFECLLCGACTNDCVTGYDPLVFIREGRTQANVLGIVPAHVQKVIDKIEKTGNMFGCTACKVDLTGEHRPPGIQRMQIHRGAGTARAYRFHRQNRLQWDDQSEVPDLLDARDGKQLRPHAG